MTTHAVQIVRRVRPWIAMAVAYALALQALLGSFVLAQAASVAAAGLAPALVLCASGDAPSHAPDAPAHVAICDHCVVCSSYQASDLPIAQSFRAQVIIAAVTFPGSRTADPPFARKTPRLSQGPPSIA